VQPSTRTPGRFVVLNEWGGWECAFDDPGAKARAWRIANAVNQAAAVAGLLTAAKEAEKEVAETITDLVGCRADNTNGVADARFDDVSQKELARLEAVHGRIKAAIAKAEGRAP
jgi:hypothetical protein